MEPANNTSKPQPFFYSMLSASTLNVSPRGLPIIMEDGFYVLRGSGDPHFREFWGVTGTGLGRRAINKRVPYRGPEELLLLTDIASVCGTISSSWFSFGSGLRFGPPSSVFPICR